MEWFMQGRTRIFYIGDIRGKNPLGFAIHVCPLHRAPPFSSCFHGFNSLTLVKTRGKAVHSVHRLQRVRESCGHGSAVWRAGDIRTQGRQYMSWCSYPSCSCMLLSILSTSFRGLAFTNGCLVGSIGAGLGAVLARWNSTICFSISAHPPYVSQPFIHIEFVLKCAANFIGLGPRRLTSNCQRQWMIQSA